MLEEQLKNEIATKYFKKYNCNDIIKRIDFSVKNDYGYLLWAEAKQQPTDIYKMLAQLLITIKADAWELKPPKFLGCFDNEKIAFIPYYDVMPVFGLNDFNWTQTPSNVDDKTVQTVKETINPNNIFTFLYGRDDENIRNFIKQNFNEYESNYLATLIDKNNFIFVYQKWRTAVMPYIDAPWDKLKRKYSVYDRDFFLAELNIDDNGTTDISDDKTVKEDFYVTFDAKNKKPYHIYMQDAFGTDNILPFGFKDDGLKHYAEFWKLYKRPPKEEIWNYIVDRLDLLVPQDVRERKGAFFTPQIWVEKSQQYIAEVLGEKWQEEYFVWDCCAGTGNLLNGLNNKYNIFASTLDQQDVDVMKERIKNGANLLESHVFQFDFLNDEFDSDKVPEDLKKILFDPEKRKKLVIYINPPYAEAGTATQVTGTGENKVGVSNQSKIWEKWKDKFGLGIRELYVQFFIRIYSEIHGCILAEFSKLKILQGTAFKEFRDFFNATFLNGFLVPANTFDNVQGKFPIGFMIWSTDEKRWDAGVSPAEKKAIKNHCRKYLRHIENQHLQFITFRLYDSVPKEIIQKWKKKLYAEENSDEKEISTKLRELIDQYEDKGFGECYLKDDRIAQIVCDALYYNNGKQYNLINWCIMPNHVHILIEVLAGNSLSDIMHTWRSFTAHEANKILGRKGQVWMEEYFDRYIRDDEHLHKTMQYIDANPIKAGLTDSPEQWRWCLKGYQNTSIQITAGETPASQEMAIFDIYNAKAEPNGTKKVYIGDEKMPKITEWITTFGVKDKLNTIGYTGNEGPDYQHNLYLAIYSTQKILNNGSLANATKYSITKNNLFPIGIYFAVRLCIEATWLNDRDQFFYPKDGWETDPEFQTNCLIYTLFHGQNRISSQQGINHWIPFSEQEVNSKSLYDSHFMVDFLQGKIKAEKQQDGLFPSTQTPQPTKLQFSEEAKAVLDCGRELWKYYHTKSDANPNASLYDIKEYFQGRNDKGKMNSSSNDATYTELLDKLKTALRTLGEKIQPKVYEYGFLKA